MIIEVKDNVKKTEISIGDAIVFINGDIRIIIATSQGFGAFDPKDCRTYYESSSSIRYLMSKYCESDIVRYIRKDNLKLMEV